ncbi:hypothetical protein [Halorubrum kocurii]|nr:hypothetical protein [Halorubrum kocurii]
MRRRQVLAGVVVVAMCGSKVEVTYVVGYGAGGGYGEGGYGE